MISCLMPTFNRYPRLAYLVEEAVECFLRQDITDVETELIICNDTPGQRLVFDHPRVKIINLDYHFETLSDKIQFMCDQAQGDYLCRWDDDDISLPWRLRYTYTQLREREPRGTLEYRASNHWYDVGHLRESDRVGNSHTMALWHRSLLARMGGYPKGRTGNEDQAFNRMLDEMAQTEISKCQRIPPEDIYYIYRWATGSSHLSGKVDKTNPEHPHKAHWDELAKRPVATGEYTIRPQWYRNHVARVKQALRRTKTPKNPLSIPNYFNYADFYDWAVAQMPREAKMVEVGCLSGASTCYLANEAKARERRIQIIGVDQGIGVNPKGLKEDFTDTPGLLENIRRCGCEDIVTVIAGESTKVAGFFPDNSLDFLFLDAGHESDDVRSDLQAWVRKVKPGGIVAGHDYQDCGHPAVAKEVDAFFQVEPLSLAWQGNKTVWMYQKPY